MANWFQQFLLITAVIGFFSSTHTLAANSDEGNVTINPIVVVEPDPEVREVYEAQIDSEFLEIGAYMGILSIEDFGSATVTGAKLSFHATEDFFLQANYGQSEAGLSALEANEDIYSFIDRDYSYYNLLVGYNLFPGESFITQKLTLNSTFYLVAGAGNTNLAEDQYFTVTLGSGYRIILKDWLTFNIDMRDHSFKSEIAGRTKRTHNLEYTAGLTAFF